MSNFLGPEELVLAETRHKGPCPGFQWIGQVLYSCDRCGNPFWEHTHEELIRDRGRVFRKSISREDATACRRRWEPVMDADRYVPPMDREAAA